MLYLLYNIYQSCVFVMAGRVLLLLRAGFFIDPAPRAG